MPRRLASGFDRNRLSLLLAVMARHGRLGLGQHDVFVNVAGGVRVDEPAADLAVVLALASAARGVALGPDVRVRRGRADRPAAPRGRSPSAGCRRRRGSASSARSSPRDARRRARGGRGRKRPLGDRRGRAASDVRAAPVGGGRRRSQRRLDPASSAWRRSSQRSSRCSSPTLRRSSPWGTRPAGSTRARRSISVSTLPRLVARRIRRSPSSTCSARSASGELEAEQAPVAAVHLPARDAWLGWRGRPGVVDARTARDARRAGGELERGRGTAARAAPRACGARAAGATPGRARARRRADRAAPDLPVQLGVAHRERRRRACRSGRERLRRALPGHVGA